MQGEQAYADSLTLLTYWTYVRTPKVLPAMRVRQTCMPAGPATSCVCSKRWSPYNSALLGLLQSQRDQVTGSALIAFRAVSTTSDSFTRQFISLRTMS